MKTKWMWMAVVGCIAGASAPSVAQACGLIIPVDGETATVDAQRVMMAYFEEENRTRVVAQIGYVGDLSNFSWIIPLPSEPTGVEAVGEDGAQLFAELDVQASPAFEVEDWTCALNGGPGGQSIPAPDVQVLQHGNTGSFEYVVLTGTGGSVVTEWLNEQGYSTPEGMAEVAHTYIREGAVFMAMKVNLEALELGQIDPAISFDYEGWPGYPLRVLKPSTTDEVEIILDVLAHAGAEATNETILSQPDVAWDGLEPQYLDAVRNADGWVVEKRGQLEDRWVDDPETGGYQQVPPPYELIEQVLGVAADSEPTLTRFHGIFTADELDQDGGITITESAQGVSSYFKTDITRSDVDCGWDEDETYDEFLDDESEGDDCYEGPCGGDGMDGTNAVGCSTTSGNMSSPLLLLLGLGLLRRRRR